MSDHSQAVDLAYHCTLFLVDPDVSREVAENAIDNAPKVRTGMSFAVRAAVLERFEPAERDPIPFVDYLPELVSETRAQEILDGLNARQDWGAAHAWLIAEVPEVARITALITPGVPEVELSDGTVLAWSGDVQRWEVAVRDVEPVFVSEHVAAVAP